MTEIEKLIWAAAFAAASVNGAPPWKCLEDACTAVTNLRRYGEQDALRAITR